MSRSGRWHNACDVISRQTLINRSVGSSQEKKVMSGKNNKQKKNKDTELMRRGFEMPTFGAGFPFSGTPFNMMRRFMDDMDRLFEGFAGSRMTPAFDTPELAFPEWPKLKENVWSPKIEVLKNNGEMTVHAEL